MPFSREKRRIYQLERDARLRAEKNEDYLTRRREAKDRYLKNPANKIKLQARSKIGELLRTGRLVAQPCVECGAEKTAAHHEDYSKPFDIVWLCTLCHGKRHRKIRQDAATRGGIARSPAVERAVAVVIFFAVGFAAACQL